MAATTFFFISFVILASCVLPAIEWQVQGDAQSSEEVVQQPQRPKRQRRQDKGTTSPFRRRSAGTEHSRSEPSSVCLKFARTILNLGLTLIIAGGQDRRDTKRDRPIASATQTVAAITSLRLRLVILNRLYIVTLP